LKILEKLIAKHNLKPTGFTSWAPPNLSWMLRCIVALEPNQRTHILNHRKV